MLIKFTIVLAKTKQKKKFEVELLTF